MPAASNTTWLYFAGHVPMLADPQFCELVHAIGLASLGASESQIWHLTKLYWYTVEFGVVKEGTGIKAFGAGRPMLLANASKHCPAEQDAVSRAHHALLGAMAAWQSRLD